MDTWQTATGLTVPVFERRKKVFSFKTHQNIEEFKSKVTQNKGWENLLKLAQLDASLE